MAINKKIALLGSALLTVITHQEVTAQVNSSGTTEYFNAKYKTGVYNSADYSGKYFTFNEFYDNLSPYGTWIKDEHYGYVWSPNVDENFRPYYTNGHWVITDQGNTWVSEYQWGWACFHYGRWVFDSYYGWLWVPGSNWGPAWVSWRIGVGQIGWATLHPQYEFTSSELNTFKCPKDWWVFIPVEHIYGNEYFKFWSGPFGNSTILKTTEPIDNTYTDNGVTYVSGPGAMQMQKILKKELTVAHINNAGTPRPGTVRKDEVKLYKPMLINMLTENGDKITPSFYIDAPKPVAVAAQSITLNPGVPTEFSRDKERLIKDANHTIVNSQGNNRQNASQHKEAQRADNFPYKSDMTVSDPIKPKSKPLTKKVEEPLPEQQSQTLEPIPTPKPKTDKVPARNSQSADPLPAQREVPESRKSTIPQQHPEPIK